MNLNRDLVKHWQKSHGLISKMKGELTCYHGQNVMHQHAPSIKDHIQLICVSSKPYFFSFGTKDLSRKNITTSCLALGQLKCNFRWVAFHVLGITLPSSSCSLYAPLSKIAMTLNGPSQLGPSFPAWDFFWLFLGLATRIELCSFFSDPDHFLDFICCLKFYPHVFFILLLLEQQSLYQRFPDVDEDHGICAICESVRYLLVVVWGEQW